MPGESPEVSATAMAAIVRVLTEALNNIDKHAGVRSADVAIAAAEEIVMTIRDHGSGFDPAGALGHQDGHLGLWVMSERARDAGGALEVTTDAARRHDRHAAVTAMSAPFDATLRHTVDGAGCPHMAVLLDTEAELPAVLASFYRLGARRNGWLVHRYLPGQEERDRAALIENGLDVGALEAEGRLQIVEFDVDEDPATWADPWSAKLDRALEAGFDALVVLALRGRARSTRSRPPPCSTACGTACSPAVRRSPCARTSWARSALTSAPSTRRASPSSTTASSASRTKSPFQKFSAPGYERSAAPVATRGLADNPTIGFTRVRRLPSTARPSRSGRLF